MAPCPTATPSRDWWPTSPARTDRELRVGISGWRYPPWRGRFYPKGLPQREELRYAAERLNSIELNGSFYSLQRPELYRAWYEQTPDGFVFAVKGSRFITHLTRLRDPTALANFLASGVLALREKLGPILWQLPPTLPFQAEVLDAFLGALPSTTAEAAYLARRHDERLKDRAVTHADADRPVRHAVEVRHPSYENNTAFLDVLRAHNVAAVLADSPGRWPVIREATADFRYLRLHGAEELYASGYDGQALDGWAAAIRSWAPADVYAYFDNDAKAYAPRDAMTLAARLRP